MILGAVVLVAVLLSAGFLERQKRQAAVPALSLPDGETLPAGDNMVPGQTSPGGIVSEVFVEDTTGTDGGVGRLIRSMQGRSLEFYKTAAAPAGLIAANDIVLLKINSQWAERGGTNTDLIRDVIQEVLNHPEGFSGEIIVADNGQAQFGSSGTGGSLDWERANAEDRGQSALDVIRSFQVSGQRVTGVLWDGFTRLRVKEFNSGDMRDGFVVEDAVSSTGIAVSYPKFTTEFATHVSFKEGIWDPASLSYNSESLKVINMPVLKSHSQYQVTAAVKSYMGVPSDMLTRSGGRAHNSIATGGLGTLMAQTRKPVLNILDMIWIGPDRGPSVSYNAAVRINKIAASVDPFALDSWAATNVLIPEAAKLPGGRARAMDPAGGEPGTFGYWMHLSMDELHKAGIAATMNPDEILVIQNGNVQ